MRRVTGWRIPSEVLPMQWRHVDFEARVARLDPHTTKNDEGRTFPFTDALHGLLEAQKQDHEDVEVQRKADRLRPARSGGRTAPGRCVSPARGLRKRVSDSAVGFSVTVDSQKPVDYDVAIGARVTVAASDKSISPTCTVQSTPFIDVGMELQLIDEAAHLNRHLPRHAQYG